MPRSQSLQALREASHYRVNKLIVPSAILTALVAISAQCLPARAESPNPNQLEPRAEQLFNQRRFSEAVPLFRRALEFKSTKEFKNALVRSHTFLARNAFDNLHDAKTAVDECNQALALKQEEGAGGIYFLRGEYLMSLGRYDSAEADLKRALAESKNNWRNYCELAKAQAAGKKLDEAIANFTAALKGAPPRDLKFVLRGRAQTYIQKGQFDKAAADYTKLIESENVEDDLMARAQCYLKAKQSAKAIADYSTVLKSDEDNDDAVRLRGDIYFAQANTVRAIQDYTLAIKIAPTSTNYNARARVYEKTNRPDLAAKDRQAASAPLQ